MNKEQTYATKVGKLIQTIRHERGMSQQAMAKALGTSQSAVNRIENGGQNLSMEMLARISDVLNQEIVTLQKPGSINFRIEGGQQLHGEIIAKTSKNAAMGLMCAALLNRGKTTLRRMPRIEEVNRMVEVLTSIGVHVRWLENNDLEIKPPAKLQLEHINAEAGRKTRSVIMLMGPLMHLLKEFDLPFAGGCSLGERTIRPHLFALQEFGLEVKATHGWYKCTSNPKAPGKVVMYEMGDTPSENTIMAAARTPGKTVIKFATSNYMVQDVMFFLQELGVKITSIGSYHIEIEGVKDINKDVEYYPAEDPIEVMSFLAVAAVTKSPITIRRAPLDFLELELLKLKKMGFNYTLSKEYKAHNGKTTLVDIICHESPKLVALEDKIHALPFPGINQDNLPFFTLIAAGAEGRTLIHDWTYEDRAIYYTELNKLGADIRLGDMHRAYVTGPTTWKPAEIICPPALRPAMLILIAMLAAKGTSTLRNVYSISRGYEDIAERLRSLGAQIEIVRDI